MTCLANRVHGRTRIGLVLLSACGWVFVSSPALAAGAPLTCGDPSALYRIEIIEQRLDTSFELFADGRVQREADERWAQETEGRPPTADRSDPTREFRSRTA